MFKVLGLCVSAATIFYLWNSEVFVASPSRTPVAARAQSLNAAAGAVTDSTQRISSPTNSALDVELKTAQLAQSMDRLQTSAQFDRETEILATSLNHADAVTLRRMALSPLRTHNERFLAVFLLAQRPAEFAQDLEFIAQADSPAFAQRAAPHTEHELKRHFEAALRVQALSALDSLSPQGKGEAAFFASLQEKHADGFVRKLARMGRVGAEQGRSLIAEYIAAKQNGVGTNGVED